MSCLCLGDFLTKSRGVVLDDASDALLIVHVREALPGTFHQVLLRPLLLSLFTLEKSLQTDTMYQFIMSKKSNENDVLIKVVQTRLTQNSLLTRSCLFP